MSKIHRIGLISDTHMPDRWKQLPQRVFEVFDNVDMIIHAGDVGELWVLDQLSRCAPVVAVHGNDETSEAEEALPYLCTLSIAGHRLVVTHAHYPDRAEELASRTNNWQSHFDRRATFAKEHGAGICIFGHLHIPMVVEHQGIRLINAGAIASGNPWMRQLVQTVAILTLEQDKTPDIQHIDLSTGTIHQPIFDPTGFIETNQHYNAPIFEDDFMPYRDYVYNELRLINVPIIHEALLSLCHQVWEGQREIVTTQSLVERFLTLEIPELTEKLEKHTYFSGFIR